MNKKFEDFNLDKYIIKALYNLNYTIPSKVQEEVIPRLLKKEDVIVQSLGSKPIIKVEFNPKQECKDNHCKV